MESSKVNDHCSSNPGIDFIPYEKRDEDLPELLQNIQEKIPWDLSDLLTPALDLEEPVQSLCVTTFHAKSENENKNNQEDDSVSPQMSSDPNVINTDENVSKSGRRKCLQCSLCDFTTNWPSHLRRHILMFHKEAVLRCENCDYFTYKEKLLKTHKLKCSNSDSFNLKAQKNKRKSKLFLLIENMKKESVDTCEQSEQLESLNQDESDSLEGNDCTVFKSVSNNVSEISSCNVLPKSFSDISVQNYSDIQSRGSDSQFCESDIRSPESKARSCESDIPSKNIARSCESDLRSSENIARSCESDIRSSESNARSCESDIPSKNTARSCESDIRSSENTARSCESDIRSSESNARSCESDIRSSESNARSCESDIRSSESNARSCESDIRSSESNARSCESDIRSSESNARSCESDIRSSESNARSCESDIRSSESNARSCESDIRSSESNARSCESNIRSSGSNARSCESDIGSSESNIRSSESNARSCESDIRSSESNARSCESDIRSSESNARSCESDIRSSESNARSCESDIRSSESNARSCESDIRSSESNARSCESDIRSSESNARSCESDIRSSESNARSCESDIRSSESNARSCESNIRSSGSNARSCESDIGSSESNIRSSESNARSCESDIRSSKSNARACESDTSQNCKASNFNIRSYRKRPLLKCSICKFKTYFFIKYCNHLKMHVAQNDTSETEELENKNIDNIEKLENKSIDSTEKMENSIENTHSSESKSGSENIIIETKKRKCESDISNNIDNNSKRKLNHGLVQSQGALQSQMDIRDIMVVLHDIKNGACKIYMEAIKKHSSNFMNAKLNVFNESNEKSEDKIGQPRNLSEPNGSNIGSQELDEMASEQECINENSELNEMDSGSNNSNELDAAARDLDQINNRPRDQDDVSSVCSSFDGFDDNVTNEDANRRSHENEGEIQFHGDKDVQDNISDKMVNNDNTSKLMTHHNQVINSNISCNESLHHKLYKCSMCNYQSKWYTCMWRHKARHTNNRFYKCQNCDYTTHTTKFLQNHQSKCIDLLRTIETESSSTISISSSPVLKSKLLSSISKPCLSFSKSTVRISEKKNIRKRRSFNLPERTRFPKRRSGPPKRFADSLLSTSNFPIISKSSVDLSQSIESTFMSQPPEVIIEDIPSNTKAIGASLKSPESAGTTANVEQTRYEPGLKGPPSMSPEQHSSSSMNILWKRHSKQQRRSKSHISDIKSSAVYNEVRENRTKNWRCRHCHHLSRSLNSYKRHLLMHSNLKVFKCKFCDYSTNVKRLTKNHYVRYHSSVINEKCSHLGGLVSRSEVLDQLCTPDEDAMNVTFSQKHGDEASITKLVDQRNCSINQIITNNLMVVQAEIHTDIVNRATATSKIIDQATVESENSSDDARETSDLSSKMTNMFKKRRRLSSRDPKTRVTCNTEQNNANAEAIAGGTNTHPTNSSCDLLNTPRGILPKDKGTVVLEKGQREAKTQGDEQDKHKKLKVMSENDSKRKGNIASNTEQDESYSVGRSVLKNCQKDLSKVDYSAINGNDSQKNQMNKLVDFSCVNSCSTTHTTKNLDETHIKELDSSNILDCSQPGGLRNNLDTSYVDLRNTCRIENGIQSKYASRFKYKQIKHVEIIENTDTNKSNSSKSVDAYSNQYSGNGRSETVVSHSVSLAQKKNTKLMHDVLSNQNEVQAQSCPESLLPKSINLVKGEYEKKIKCIIDDARAFFSGLENVHIDSNSTTKIQNLVNGELYITGPKNKSTEGEDISCKIASKSGSKQSALVDNRISNALSSTTSPINDAMRLVTTCTRGTSSPVDFSNERLDASDDNLSVSLNNDNDPPYIHLDNNSSNDTQDALVDRYSNKLGALVDSSSNKLGSLIDSNTPVVISDSITPGVSSKRKRNIKTRSNIKINRKQVLTEKENKSSKEDQTCDRKKLNLNNKSDLNKKSDQSTKSYFQNSNLDLQNKLDHQNISDFQNTKSDLQNTKSGLQNTKTGLQNTKTGLQNTKSDLQNTKTGLQNTKTGLQNTKSDLQNTKTGLQNTKSDLQNTKTGPQNRKLNLRRKKLFRCPFPSCTFQTKFSGNVRRHFRCHKDAKDMTGINSSLVVTESSRVTRHSITVTSSPVPSTSSISNVDDCDSKHIDSVSKSCGFNKSKATRMSIRGANNITASVISAIGSDTSKPSDKSSLGKRKSSEILTDNKEASLLKPDYPTVREVAKTFDSVTVPKFTRDKFCNKRGSQSLSNFFNEIDKRTIATRMKITYGRGERLKNKDKKNTCKKRFVNTENGKRKDNTNKTTKTWINEKTHIDIQSDKNGSENGKIKSGNEISVRNSGMALTTDQNSTMTKKVDKNFSDKGSVKRVPSNSIKAMRIDDIKTVTRILSKRLKNNSKELLINDRRSSQRNSTTKRTVVARSKVINATRKRQIKEIVDGRTVGRSCTEEVDAKRTSKLIKENLQDCNTLNGVPFTQNSESSIETKQCRKKENFLYNCLDCPRKTNSKYAMVIHVRTKKHRANIYTCRRCTFQTHDYHAYQKHKVVHLNKNVCIFRCLVCHFVTSWKAAMKTHVEHFLHRAYLYKCKKCSAQFCEKEEHLVHVNNCFK